MRRSMSVNMDEIRVWTVYVGFGSCAEAGAIKSALAKDRGNFLSKLPSLIRTLSGSPIVA